MPDSLARCLRCRVFSAAFGIQEGPTAPRSPWQNACAVSGYSVSDLQSVRTNLRDPDRPDGAESIDGQRPPAFGGQRIERKGSGAGYGQQQGTVCPQAAIRHGLITAVDLV